MRRLLAVAASSCALVAVAAAEIEIRPGDRTPFELGERTSYTFPGRMGQLLSVGLDGVRHTPAIDSNSRFHLLKPDGSAFGGLGCRDASAGGARCKLVLPPLPLSGRYTVVIEPHPKARVSGTLVLNEDLRCALARGHETRISIESAGQVARCTFEAAGSQAIVPGVAVLERDGARTDEIVLTLQPPGNMGGAMRVISPQEKNVVMRAWKLPSSGTYTVLVDPGFATLPSIGITLPAP